MKDYKLYSLKNEISSSQAPVVLFGAGSYSGIARYAMDQHGIPVSYFCDSDEKKHGQKCCGLDIISSHALAGIDLNAHIFISSNYIGPISAELSALGFTNIYDCAPLFDNTDFTKADIKDFSKGDVPMSLSEIYRKITTHRNTLHGVAKRPGMQVRMIDVVVTEACTMKCKDCSNLMQYYTKPKNSDPDLLLKSFDKIAQSVGGFLEVRLLGGEPFLNKKLHAIVDKIASYDHVEKIAIFTNATIIPKEANLTSLKNPKVFLDITHYGDKLSRNHDKLIEALEANDIAYVTHVPQPWTDSAKIQYHKREPAQIAEMFSKCCVNDIMTLLNGKLYRCPFSAHATNLKAIPTANDEIIDLMDDTIPHETIKASIEDLYTKKPYIFACSYCKGRDYTTASVEPGVQTKTVLPLAKVFEDRVGS